MVYRKDHSFSLRTFEENNTRVEKFSVRKYVMGNYSGQNLVNGLLDIVESSCKPHAKAQLPKDYAFNKPRHFTFSVLLKSGIRHKCIINLWFMHSESILK